MRVAWFLPLVGLVLAGCGGSEPTMTPNANELAFVTPEFDAPAGDSFECFYTSTTTDREINVAGATGTQGPGGHHVIIYYTDVPRDPTHHPCVDAEMVSWHQIAGAAQSQEPIAQVPAGAAVKVPAGKQLVIQSHYINTTGVTEKVKDSISLNLLESKDVKEFVNFYAMVDLGFQVPPMATGQSVTTCTVPNDLNSVLMIGHMHSYGKHFKLETIDDAGTSLSTIYEHDWEPLFTSHPPLLESSLESPYAIKAGTRLRQTCEWNNTTPDPLAFPREMCVSFIFYYPDQGYLECDGQPETP